MEKMSRSEEREREREREREIHECLPHRNAIFLRIINIILDHNSF